MGGTSLNILIVDDDANLRSSLNLELKNAGHRVSLASSGRRALESFPRMEFDVVLADAEMPDGSGVELIELLRGRGFQTPVVLSSAISAEDETPWEQYGAAGFLTKPCKPSVVLEQLRRACPARRDFTYFLNARRSLVVASWIGELRAQDGPVLQRCRSEIAATRSKYVILNLHGFTDYDAVLAGDIVSFQQALRDMPSGLVLCGLAAPLLERLARKGLVNESEIMANLQAALQYLIEIGLNGKD